MHLVDRQRLQQPHDIGVERVGDRDGERAVGDDQRQHVVVVCIGGLDQRDRVGFRCGVAQVDDRNVELFAQGAGDVVFGDHPSLDEHPAEPLAVGMGSDELEGVAGDHAGVHQDVADADPRFGDREVRDELRPRGCGAFRLVADPAPPHAAPRARTQT